MLLCHSTQVNGDVFLQLEQELRAAFPRVIGDSDLRNLWFYKYSPSLFCVILHRTFLD